MSSSFFSHFVKNIDDGKADGIAIFDEIDRVHGGKFVADLMREEIDLFAA